VVGPPKSIANSELLGQSSPNAVYLGQRLRYETERDLEELDPLKSGRYFSELARHAFLVFAIWAVGLIPLSIVGLILGLAKDTFGTVVTVMLWLAWSLLMACVYWLRKLPGQLSEWKFGVDDKGGVAPVVFDHIGWAFNRRRTPVDSIKARPFALEGQDARIFLEVRQGIFYGLVSCFANGDDLFIGWTFWLYISPARFLWIGIRRIIWELQFRGNGLYVSLQFDRAKAFREALHSSVREGVDVAAGQLEAQGRGTIGTAIPFANDNSGTNWAPQAPAPTGSTI
jgi:hypothetical protein